ncbi:MAG: AAA family ATPase, partial [Dehalococcoidia bacterium]
TLPELPHELGALLGKTLEGVAEDAERRVTEQVAAHGMHARGEAWLSEGLRYSAQSSCPFCDQSLDGDAAALIAAYRAYFSEAYDQLRREVRTVRERIASDLGDRPVAAVESILSQNEGGHEFWSRYTEMASPRLPDAAQVGDTIRALRVAALALLDRKASSPLDAISLDTRYAEAVSAMARLRDDVGAYNARVASANEAIATRKAATASSDIQSVDVDLARLRASKKRHEMPTKAACEEYQRAEAEKTDIENAKAAVRTDLDGYTGQVIERYERKINQLLDDFNAGFRITRTSHGYPGGVASSSYQILINDTPVPLGDARTPVDQPSFRNTLSSGDRSTLALAFFLAQLHHDPDRGTKLVVFDDPFTSQDSFRRDCTVQKIKRCGEASQQVIVLSHDPRFLKRIWDRLDMHAAERKSLEMTRVGRLDTTICAWDIEEATQAAYNADRGALKDYHLHAQGAPRDIVQKIRPVLESYCRYVGGGAVSSSDTLGVIVGRIRDVGSTHVLFPVLDDLDGLNEYTRRYHHGDNPDAATEPIDQTELDGFVRRTLDITGGC